LFSDIHASTDQNSQVRPARSRKRQAKPLRRPDRSTRQMKEGATKD
jgi:hypothetical protein